MSDTTERLTIGAVQFQPVFGAVADNLAAIERLVPTVEADLLVLPELALTGYTFTSREDTRHFAESFDDSPSLDRLQRLARERDCALVVGFAELAGDSVYNSAAVLFPDGTRARYRKIHLFGSETEAFDPGDSPFTVIDYRGVKLGVIICFDWYFPESIRVLALEGADIICQPANLVLHWCQRGMMIRSLENRVFTITANRYGAEDRGGYSYTFTGQSQMTAPDGSVLASAPEIGDSVITATIDSTIARSKRINRFNDLWLSRRPELYGPITTAGETA